MIIKLCLNIIIFLVNLVRNVEIIIPFNSTFSQIPRNLTPINFITSLIENELYTNFDIGTPFQNLDFLIDFNSYHTYIMKDNKKNKNYKRFLYNKSSTFKYLGPKEYFYDLDFSSAINSSDILSFKENIINVNYTFLHVIDKSPSSKDKYPGVIGLGVVSNGQPFHANAGLIYQLKHKNITNNYIYTLIFNKDDFNGNIIVEKNFYDNYPIDNFMNKYCIVTPEYSYHWGWENINSYLDSEELEITRIYFKPELGVIAVNPSIMEILMTKFFNEKIKDGKCYKDFRIFSFLYCDKDVKIDIGKLIFKNKMKNIEFSIDSNDLTLEYNNKIFFLLVSGIRLPKNEAYLGYPFSKKYNLIFNQGDRTVGFYNFNKNNNDKGKDDKKTNEKERYKKAIYLTKKFLPFFIVLFSIIFLYVVFYVYRQIKRKTNEKLYEELNESSND